MCPTCSISREAMTDSEIAAHAKDIINQQLLAVALALATKDRDDQIPYLVNLIDATAKEAGMAIEKAFNQFGAPESSRNHLFAECVEHAANIKRMSIGLAGALQEDRDRN